MTTSTSTANPVAWFEIGTGDPEAARAFYGGAFGWTFVAEGAYLLISTGPDEPPTGGIQDTNAGLPAGTPPAYAVPCVQVADVAATCARVEELGGKVDVGATSPPAGPTYALVQDPAGNRIGLFAPMAEAG
jgi:predicted enzyme related to lactoylglutathione lyase